VGVVTPEVLVTGPSDAHEQCSAAVAAAESPGYLLWSTLSPGEVFATDGLHLAPPRMLSTSSSAPQARIYRHRYCCHIPSGHFDVVNI